MRAFFAVLPYALMPSASAQGGDRPIGPFDFTARTVTVVSRGVRVPAVLTVPRITGTNMMADVAAARAYAIANAPIDTKAVGIFGYSMGGRLAMLSAASGYKALGLLAPKGNDGNDDPNFSEGGPQAYAEVAAKAKADGHAGGERREEECGRRNREDRGRRSRLRLLRRRSAIQGTDRRGGREFLRLDASLTRCPRLRLSTSVHRALPRFRAARRRQSASRWPV